MEIGEIWTEAFQRVHDGVHRVVDGTSGGALTGRVDPDSNTVAWLVWHLTRIQDDHVAQAFGTEQVWLAQGFAERFGLALDPSDTGYGHGSEEVAAVDVGAEELTTYYDAVHESTRRLLGGLTAADLDRVVDDTWDPPVTLGVRLVSVLSDDLQHVGQAAYVRGVLERR